MASKTQSLADRIMAQGKSAGRHEGEVPEWGATVYLHEMSTREAQEFASLSQEVDADADGAVQRNLDATVDLLMRSVRDADGARVFTTDDHRDFLLDQPLRLTARLVKQLMDTSSVSVDADAAKNG